MQLLPLSWSPPPLLYGLYLGGNNPLSKGGRGSKLIKCMSSLWRKCWRRQPSCSLGNTQCMALIYNMAQSTKTFTYWTYLRTSNLIGFYLFQHPPFFAVEKPIIKVHYIHILEMKSTAAAGFGHPSTDHHHTLLFLKSNHKQYWQRQRAQCFRNGAWPTYYAFSAKQKC